MKSGYIMESLRSWSRNSFLVLKSALVSFWNRNWIWRQTLLSKFSESV